MDQMFFYQLIIKDESLVHACAWSEALAQACTSLLAPVVSIIAEDSSELLHWEEWVFCCPVMAFDLHLLTWEGGDKVVGNVLIAAAPDGRC